MLDDTFTADDAMCVLALASASVYVSTTLDLVGMPPNEQALQVLCRLLPHATSPLLREAIVSILSVRQAKGLAGECLLQEFRRADQADALAPNRRRAVAFGIAVVATDQDFYPILDLLQNDNFSAESKGPLVLALGEMDSLAQPASRVLLETLDSPDLSRWAVMVIATRNGEEALAPLKRLAGRSTGELKEAAEQAIRAIQARTMARPYQVKSPHQAGGAVSIVPEPGGGWRMSAGPALFCCFGLLYALTWNGRYLHDGPLFLQDLQDGTWLHVHVAYLPFAHLLKLALTWFPGMGGPEALAVLAILSGASMVALSYSLCARLTGDWIAGLAVGLLVGVAPVVWSASGMVEIHIFAGAGACAAAWLAYHPRGSPALRSALATLLALCFHMTNIAVVPLLVALATSIGRKRSMVRELAITIAGTGAVVAVMRSVGHALPPKVESLSGVLPGLIDLFSGFWKDPSVLGNRLLDEYVRPWLLLCLGPALALLPGGRVPLPIRAVSAAMGIAGAGLVAIYIPLAGQYGLVLCPVLAIGAAQAASVLRPGLGRAVLLGLLLAVSALAAVPERERLVADPDREWAIQVSPFLGPSDVVLCFGMARKMRIREFTEATAVDFMPSGDSGSAGAEGATESAVRKLTQEGQRLYLDPLVLSKGPQFPTLEPIVAAIRQAVVLEDVEEAPLVRARLTTDR